jgi:hypothetical protein
VVVGASVLVVGATVVVENTVVDATSSGLSSSPPQVAITATVAATSTATANHGRRITRHDRAVTSMLTPTCVWRLRPELIIALDERFGEPTDAYVNGSQTWLRDDGPGGVAVEWRLHPVAGFRRPDDVGVHELFEVVAFALANGDRPPTPPDALWEGLEAFPAYGDAVEPAQLASSVGGALGIDPDVYGLVDHQRIGDDWERTSGGISVLASLLSQLGKPPLG